MKKIITISIISAVVLISVITSVILLSSKSKNLTDLEESIIKDVSNKTMLYMETVEGYTKEDGDVYIAYALMYSYNENDKATLTIDEIESIVKEVFNVKLDKEKLTSGVMTPVLSDNFITYDNEKEEYTINVSEKSYTDIATTEIPVYVYESASKKKDKFIVTYKKYVVSNPY